ncbi:MAG: hypothetical protein E7214_02360 [Clostridium sp.]|nr:hypothetical protein [Clostridium sp.]
MNFYDVEKILRSECYNKEIVVTEDGLQENMSYPGDDYYNIKKLNDKYFFYQTSNERQKEIKLLGEYESEEEACLYFLLNRLDSYYLNKYIIPEENTSGLIANMDILNEQYLEEVLYNLGIDKLIKKCIMKGYLKNKLDIDYIIYFLGSK